MELLQPQLDATTNYFLENLPKAANDIFQQVLDSAIEKHVTDNALKVGQRISDFTLPTANGSTFKLSTQLKKGPIVLFFYRGSWCPYCNLAFKSFHAMLPQIQELGATLVGVSPEFPEKAQETMTKEGYRFEVLTDENNGLAGQLGLLFKQNQAALDTMKNLGFDLEQYYGTGKGFVLPIPATFVIHTDQRIAYSYINPNYRFRAEPFEVIEALRKIMIDR